MCTKRQQRRRRCDTRRLSNPDVYPRLFPVMARRRREQQENARSVPT